MSVGVNYAALDSERQRQEDLLRELRELEKEMTSPPFDKTQLPQLASNVGTLTGNVGSCWDYVDQLASLAQIHLKSAAEYHQFFHEANELESKMERQLAIAKDRQELNPGRLIYKETSRLANEIRVRYVGSWSCFPSLNNRFAHKSCF
ncbi:unnamed protein product [Dibothriocephalus latus]|uniref:Uncharacterized protein n=1 Tax=Dibothriocephalus latus TaxID=60516 RepID=A0A3P7P2P0_DIBLA|nr:unnamed protein product [Dibothriocephalus latus]